MKITYLALLLVLFFIPAQYLIAQDSLESLLQYEHNAQSRLWTALLDHDDAWYQTDEAKQIAENILLYQRDAGGWPKNINFSIPVTSDQKIKIKEYSDEYLPTIDNGATYTQLQFLARLIQLTGQDRYILAFLKGFDYLLDAQYDNGGWPQFYPLVRGYYSHITYNDDAMVGVLYLLLDVTENPDRYNYVDDSRKQRARAAIDAGIECILKTQIKVDGKLTGWCAQYDEKTLEPRQARTYELVSLSGKASVGILRFLMSLDDPAPEIITAVQSGIAWLDQVRIEDIRVVREPDENSESGFNKVVVSDTHAPSMWARFYKIGNNEPFFSDRDGGVYKELSDISFERRNAYGWLGYWPAMLLEADYPKWLNAWSIKENVLKNGTH